MKSITAKSALAASVILALLLLAVPASAQRTDKSLGRGPAGGLSGIRIAATTIDSGTLMADVDLTIWYGGTIGFSTAWVGDTTGFGTIAPAIDWGDGSSLPPIYPTGIAFSTTSTPPGATLPQRAYRASFSHTYPALGDYVATAYSSGLIFQTSTPAFTGNTVTLQTPTYSVFGGTRMLLSNTAEIGFVVNPLEVPTSSTFGLMAMIVGMVGGAVFLLRR